MVFDDLFKFCSLSINSLSALSHSCAWFAKQDSFNDPFEGIYKISESYTTEKLLDFVVLELVKTKNIEVKKAEEIVDERYRANPDATVALILKGINKIHQDKAEYARNLGVLSTSADIPDDARSHVTNILMWSHYGDGLRGICIKFDAEELYKSLCELNGNDKFAWAKVDYDNKPHIIEFLPASDEDDFSYIKALQLKHDQWGYECECRIFCSKTGLKHFSRKSVKSIYIGDKMPADNEALIIDLMKSNYPHAEIYKVKIDTESFGIKISKKERSDSK